MTALKDNMEFAEKLQQLRKQKGLTQEELAGALFVSRTAVSKWESGRGYPNLDSLKAIADFFSVTVDQLLSGEALPAAESKPVGTGDVRFGALDCTGSLLMILPLFGERGGEAVRAVPLVTLSGVAMYLKLAYLALVLGLTVLGLLTLALQNRGEGFWPKWKRKLSYGLTGAGVLLFTAGLQPYAAVWMFALLLIKLFWAGKRQ